VQRHATDTAPPGNGERHLAAAIQQMHATIDDVAEIETVGGIPHRTLDKAIARCNTLHRTLPHAADDGRG